MKRIIVGMSGASGQIYGVRLLEVLSEMEDVETHLVVSPSARKNMEVETGDVDLESLATHVYEYSDVGARIASGSFPCDGMIISPCSIKMASSIAYSITDNLIARSADVVLKQKKTLVAVVRETPLHVGHLRSLTRLAEIGAVIFPPVPAFYIKPSSIDDIVNHTVGRVLDFFEIEHELYSPWEGI